MFWWEKFNFLTFFVTKLKIFEIFIKIFCFSKIFRKIHQKRWFFRETCQKLKKSLQSEKSAVLGSKSPFLALRWDLAGPLERGSGPDPPSKTPFLARGTGFGQVPFAVHRLKNPIIFFAIFDGDVLPPTPVLFWVSGGSPKMAIFGPFFDPSRGPKKCHFGGQNGHFRPFFRRTSFFTFRDEKWWKIVLFINFFNFYQFFRKFFEKNVFFDKNFEKVKIFRQNVVKIYFFQLFVTFFLFLKNFLKKIFFFMKKKIFVENFFLLQKIFFYVKKNFYVAKKIFSTWKKIFQTKKWFSCYKKKVET